VTPGCDGVLSPEKVPSSLGSPLPGRGCVIPAGGAELVDGDATEGGCGGRDVGSGSLVLSAGSALSWEGKLRGGSGGGGAGDLGDDSAGGSSETDGRLPTLLLKPDGEIGEKGAGELGMGLLGGLFEMRMLTSRERNIWRIGTLQSVNSSPVEEVVGVAVVASDELLRFDEGDDDREV
jgi:hypothetical protein